MSDDHDMALLEEEELLQFLAPTSRTDVKAVAMKVILGLTGTPEGHEKLLKNGRFLKCVAALSMDSDRFIREDALQTLVNLSADVDAVDSFAQIDDPPLITCLLKSIADPGSEQVDIACQILSNLTRHECGCSLVFRFVGDSDIGLTNLVDIFCKENYNPKSKLHYLANLLSNLSQLKAIRSLLVQGHEKLFLRLLPYAACTNSVVRREGIARMIRNCCFDTEWHELLLGPDVDLLPYLLFPLAGPEEFPDDEVEQLPPDLQYLGSDKQREPSSQIRLMLLEALLQLCATKHGRKFLRDKQTFLIVKALYNWEEVPEVKLASRKLIGILISDEPEKGMENLRAVDVPEDLVHQFTTEEDELAQELKEIELNASDETTAT